MGASDSFSDEILKIYESDFDSDSEPNSPIIIPESYPTDVPAHAYMKYYCEPEKQTLFDQMRPSQEGELL